MAKKHFYWNLHSLPEQCSPLPAQHSQRIAFAIVEIHRSRAASLKDYHGDLQKILVFSMSPLWRVWWPPGHSELFCMTSLSIADAQRHCQTRTSSGDTSICVGDDTWASFQISFADSTRHQKKSYTNLTRLNAFNDHKTWLRVN